MQDTHKMEAMSVSFVSTILNWQGVNIASLKFDYGIDILLKKVDIRNRTNGSKRYIGSSQIIDVQLKSCFERYVTRNTNTITYNLEVDNYNDLVERRNDIGAFCPLILILFILPNDINQTLSVNQSDLVLRQNAYWYRPDIGASFSGNSSKQVVYIPTINKLDLNTNLFDIFYP